VLNQCLTKDGTMSSARADGKIADKSTNAKLKVRFAPSFLSVFPFVWANYWVIALDPEYKWAVVGEPKREFLWILSRESEMSDKLFQDILRRTEAMGYNPAKVEKTVQNVESLKGNVVSN
jgi:apolipoprotein D and lipocalin family protein